MSKRRRTRIVALAEVLRRHRPDTNVVRLIESGAVLVNGGPATNPAARVPADAAIRLRPEQRLRGDIKLSGALADLGVDVRGRIALDVGAAAGGFTRALLRAGVARVYAVDVGHGALKGSLRIHCQVVNLERTNLGTLRHALVPDEIDVVTMDLSYLAVADAVPQLEHLRLSPDIDLICLVKPTYELRAAKIANEDRHVEAAVGRARGSVEAHGWVVVRHADSRITGRRAAREVFLHARRRGGRTDSGG